MSSSIFSLSWFKRQSELENLVIEEQKLKNEILKKELGVSIEKPYLSIKLVNDVLTIVLNDGSVLTKPNATESDYWTAFGASSESLLFSLCYLVFVIRRKC
jgi:hypothetical protein